MSVATVIPDSFLGARDERWVWPLLSLTAFLEPEMRDECGHCYPWQLSWSQRWEISVATVIPDSFLGARDERWVWPLLSLTAFLEPEMRVATAIPDSFLGARDERWVWPLLSLTAFLEPEMRVATAIPDSFLGARDERWVWPLLSLTAFLEPEMTVECWVRTSVTTHPKGCWCGVYKGTTSPHTPQGVLLWGLQRYYLSPHTPRDAAVGFTEVLPLPTHPKGWCCGVYKGTTSPHTPRTLASLLLALLIAYASWFLVEQRAATTPLQRTRFWLVLFSSAHVFPAAFIWASMLLPQVCFGQPTLRFPCGFQSRACLVMLDASFRSVWPIQPHFRFLISVSIGVCFILSHSCSAKKKKKSDNHWWEHGCHWTFAKNNWKSTCACRLTENEHEKRQKVQKEKDEIGETREY